MYCIYTSSRRIFILNFEAVSLVYLEEIECTIYIDMSIRFTFCSWSWAWHAYNWSFPLINGIRLFNGSGQLFNMADKKLTIAILTNANCAHWRKNIVVALKSRWLCAIVNDTENVGEGATTEVTEQFVQGQMKAIQQIISSISKDLLI